MSVTTREYAHMSLQCLTERQRENSCGYWYTITDKATAHTAFRVNMDLHEWLETRNLSLAADIPSTVGEHKVIEVIGTYRTMSYYQATGEFLAIEPLVCIPFLNNGEYTIGKITEDTDGTRTVHYLNPNDRNGVYPFHRTDDGTQRRRPASRHEVVDYIFTHHTPVADDELPEPAAGELLTVHHWPGTSALEIVDPLEGELPQPRALPGLPENPSLDDVEHHLRDNRFRVVGKWWNYDDDQLAATVEFMGFLDEEPATTTETEPTSSEPAPPAHTTRSTTPTPAQAPTPDPYVIVLSLWGFAVLDRTARIRYGVPLHPDTLSYEHAMTAMADYLGTYATDNYASVKRDGRTIADTTRDADATVQILTEIALEMAPRIDDDRTLRITIAPTWWQRITRRTPATLTWHPPA
ncbi:hypothetical protein ACFWPX_30065 [Nocardia sp. NPDC058518]|uniref:hypothetical protein n=1 Tax=Nocardia sp. NPDC058518 TaxID=3346534 RepID=UPI00364E0099